MSERTRIRRHADRAVDDWHQICDILDVIVDRLIPGRLADVRPSTDQERAQTSVIELPLDEISAKTRSGPPEDDPGDMGEEVWAGVIPVSLVNGEPVPAPDLREGIEVPDYLRDFRG